MAKKARPKAKPARTDEGPFFRPFAALKNEAPKKAAPAVAPKPPPPAPSHSPAPRDAGSAARDADTFAIYMAGVRALDGKATRIPRTASRLERAPESPLPAIDRDAPARASMASLVTEGLRFEVSDDGDRIEGRRLDVDPREVRQLRRGQYAIDGKLDLHGMTVGEARPALEAFLRKRRLDGDRAVVIVHGKGTHSPSSTGLLRGEIGAWLSQGRAARDVAAFTSAGPVFPVEAPSGAVYVLLAR